MFGVQCPAVLVLWLSLAVLCFSGSVSAPVVLCLALVVRSEIFVVHQMCSAAMELDTSWSQDAVYKPVEVARRDQVHVLWLLCTSGHCTDSLEK